jgi:glucose/arabinose dehydrogenase
MRKSSLLISIFALAIFLTSAAAEAQFELEEALPNLSFQRPVDLQHAGDGTDRLFIVEQSGLIAMVERSGDEPVSTVFLDIRDRVNDGGNEEGLLGLAFHPAFSDNGFLYVNYTASSPRRTVIARFSVSSNAPNTADPNSERIILEFGQPFGNHNGGQLSFGADGYLYIATGDGGSGGDPQGNGQNLNTLLGKILRLDVDATSAERNYVVPPDNPFIGAGEGTREEIYAYGLRNPWRFSFDPLTGLLWTGDVGQNAFEEINIVRKGGNYGWKIMEANACFSPSSNCDPSGLELPLWDYGRSLGASVTGGFVYRGNRVPELSGAYIYADFVSGRIWSLRYDGENPPTNTELLDTNLNIAAFGIDAAQNLYLCAFDGRIYRFKATAPPAPTAVTAEQTTLPAQFTLIQNYPNPFNSTTLIRFSLPHSAPIDLSLYNLSGQKIKTLINGHRSAGSYIVDWHGTDANGNTLASGAYLYRLRFGNQVQSRKLTLLQ